MAALSHNDVFTPIRVRPPPMWGCDMFRISQTPTPGRPHKRLYRVARSVALSALSGRSHARCSKVSAPIMSKVMF